MDTVKQNTDAHSLIGRMFASNKVAHAVALITDDYIDAARTLAASIICEKQVYPPCGTCDHCKNALKNIHPDIIEIAPLKGKVYISVDQIRQLRMDAYVRPNEARNKVFIINGAGKMNTEAQNAILTILEQPPNGVHFVLCDSTLNNLLPTVVSRLAVFYPETKSKEKPKKFEEKCNTLLKFYSAKNEAQFYEEMCSVTKKEQAEQLLYEFSEYIALEIKKINSNKKELIILFDNIMHARRRLQNSGNLSLTLAAMCAKCWEDN